MYSHSFGLFWWHVMQWITLNFQMGIQSNTSFGLVLANIIGSSCKFRGFAIIFGGLANLCLCNNRTCQRLSVLDVFNHYVYYCLVLSTKKFCCPAVLFLVLDIWICLNLLLIQFCHLYISYYDFLWQLLNVLDDLSYFGSRLCLKHGTPWKLQVF